MHFFRFACVVVLLAMPAVSLAQAPDPVALVKQLGDESLRKREQADRALLALGRAALPALEAGARDADPEIRTRCQRLLPLVGRNDTELLLDRFATAAEMPKDTPLPAWAAISKLVGDDGAGRELYVQAYRADLALLQALEKDPQSAIGLLNQRGLVLHVAGNRPALDRTVGQTVAVMAVLTLAKNPGEWPMQHNMITQFLYQPNVVATMRSNRAARRLIVAWLERRGLDPLQLMNTGQLGMLSNLGLADVLQDKMRPAAERICAEAADHPEDIGRFQTAVNLATNLRMNDVLDKTMRPAARRMVEAAGRDPIDINRLNQAYNAAQMLRMDQELTELMRPLCTKVLQGYVKDRRPDISQFYSLHFMLQRSCPDLIESHLRPALRGYLVDVSSNGDINQFYQALNIARSVGMTTEVESLLKPAGVALVQGMVADAKDAAQLQQAAGLSAALGLQDVGLKSAVVRLLQDLGKQPPDINRTTQVLHLARQVSPDNVSDLIDKHLVPQVRKSLVDAAAQPIDQNRLYQYLNLARELKLKEGLAVACKAAENRSLPPHTRSFGLMYAMQNGGKEQLPMMEALLEDSSALGQSVVNVTATQTQVRDVALAALIHLSDQKIEDYAFPFFQNTRLPVQQMIASSNYSCFGFPNDEARAAALKQWRASQPKR